MSETSSLRNGRWFLTYALHALSEGNALDLLAFKGGTCLRKIVFGSTGRFSEDLDFTLRGDDEQTALTALYEVFNRAHHGVEFVLDEWYETDGPRRSRDTGPATRIAHAGIEPGA